MSGKIKTLTGSCSYSGTLTENNSDNSYYRIDRDEGGYWQTLLGKPDEYTYVNCSVNTDEKNKFKANFSYHNGHYSVDFVNGGIVVVILPSHPRYDSFPEPEEEVDPFGTVGKILCQRYLHESEYIPF